MSVLKLASVVALILVLVPCLAFALGSLTLTTVHWVVLAGTILWFATTPFWMVGELPPDADQPEI